MPPQHGAAAPHHVPWAVHLHPSVSEQVGQGLQAGRALEFLSLRGWEGKCESYRRLQPSGLPTSSCKAP